MAVAARLACSLLLLASAVAPAPAAPESLLRQAAGRYSIVPANSEIAFYVPSIGGGGIQGRFTEFDGEFVIDGDLTRSQVSIVIKPGSAATGRERVDRFIRGPSVFDAARHPQATFESTGVVRAGPRTAVVDGVLTANGIRRPVRLQATLLKLSGREAAFEVAGEFPRSWFDMAAGVPLYADKVRLSVIVTGRRR